MIALFAAVSFSMSQSLRGSGATITKDKAKIAANEIVTYLNQVRTGVKTLRINGCDILKINFNNSENKKGNNTAIDTAPAGAQDSCSVFKTSGAGVKARNFEEYASPSVPSPAAADWKAGHAGTRYVDASQGTSENDLSHNIVGVDMNVCRALLSLASSGQDTDFAVGNYGRGGGNSYTPGAAGSLTPVPKVYEGGIYVVKIDSLHDYCNVGIIAYVN